MQMRCCATTFLFHCGHATCFISVMSLYMFIYVMLSLYTTYFLICHSISVHNEFLNEWTFLFQACGGRVGSSPTSICHVLSIFLSMDARQLTSLNAQQLIALALAILCEFARRLNVPITVSADIGEDTPIADESGMSSAPTNDAAAASSHEHPWSAPAPSTPTGPMHPD